MLLVKNSDLLSWILEMVAQNEVVEAIKVIWAVAVIEVVAVAWVFEAIKAVKAILET